jgi:hypothetical protein
VVVDGAKAVGAVGAVGRTASSTHSIGATRIIVTSEPFTVDSQNEVIECTAVSMFAII